MYVCVCVRESLLSQMRCHIALLQGPREALHTLYENMPGTQRKHFILLQGYAFIGPKPLNQYLSVLNSYMPEKGL